MQPDNAGVTARAMRIAAGLEDRGTQETTGPPDLSDADLVNVGRVEEMLKKLENAARSDRDAVVKD